jgi:hypothetical protein
VCAQGGASPRPNGPSTAQSGALEGARCVRKALP